VPELESSLKNHRSNDSLGRWQRRALPDIIIHQHRSDYDIFLPQIAKAHLMAGGKAMSCNTSHAEKVIADLKRNNPMTRILDWRHHLSIKSKIRPIMSSFDSKNTMLGFDKIILKNEFGKSVEIVTKALGQNFTSFYPRSTSIKQASGSNVEHAFADSLKFIKEEGQNTAWVLKPDDGAESRGVEFYESPNLLVSRLQSEKFSKELLRHSLTTQKMVHPPLLFNKRKLELRIFFTVSSVRPLVVDLFTDGVARIAQKPYSSEDFKDKCAHFTNQQNLKTCNGSYVLRHSCKPNTITGLLDFISAEVGQHVSAEFWQKIADRALRIAMLMRHRHFEARKRAIELYDSNIAATKALLDDNGFQMVGLDTIFDADGNLFVFEANASPSLQPRKDYMNFTHYVESHLRAVGILPPAAESIAHMPGYYELVRKHIDNFAHSRNISLPDYDQCLLLDIARGHDEPMHDRHWRVYPRTDKFDEFAPKIEKWPGEETWIKSARQDVVNDIIAREFLTMYAESSRDNYFHIPLSEFKCTRIGVH